MSKLKEHFQLSNDQIEMRNLICQLLQSVLEEVYLGCKVKPFGSTVNGLGHRQCDLDVTLLTNSGEEIDADSMREMRALLERFAPGFKNVYLVESQKNCSIIKMLHTESNINVDLSVNNRSRTYNSLLNSSSQLPNWSCFQHFYYLCQIQLYYQVKVLCCKDSKDLWKKKKF